MICSFLLLVTVNVKGIEDDPISIAFTCQAAPGKLLQRRSVGIAQGIVDMFRRRASIDVLRHAKGYDDAYYSALLHNFTKPQYNEVLRRLSTGSRLPQLLRGPSVGRKSRHTYVDDLPRLQFNDEKRKE